MLERQSTRLQVRVHTLLLQPNLLGKLEVKRNPYADELLACSWSGTGAELQTPAEAFRLITAMLREPCDAALAMIERAAR